MECITYLLAVQQDTPVNNHPAGVIHTMRKARPEDYHVYPALHLREHQASDGGEPFPPLLLSPLGCLVRRVVLQCPLVQVGTGVHGKRGRGADVWQVVREVPPLEDLLVNVVAVVATQEGLRSPSPPVQRLLVLDTVRDLLERPVRTSPEVEQVVGVPAL